MTMRRLYEEYFERYLPKFLVLLLYSSLTSILGIIISFLTFLPLIITLNHDHGVTISDESVDHLRDLLNSNLFVHTCIAALGCTFPLLCEHILDISMAKFKSTTIAQCCLILAIVVPSIVLYQASLYGHVTVGLYSSATSTQDMLYFGAILSFHSHFSKSTLSKISILIIYLSFSIGVMLTSFYNVGIGPVVINYIGLFLVLFGVVGIYLSFLIRLYEHIIQLWNHYHPIDSTPILSHSMRKHTIRDNLYLYILILNLTFRLLLFQFISSGDGDTKAIHGQPYYIMINTISVVFLSILNSRQLKMKFFQIQNRFETKRNFVRYISHSRSLHLPSLSVSSSSSSDSEIRTPLNCVQIGIELALQELKKQHLSLSSLSSLPTKATRYSDSALQHSSMFSSQSQDAVDNQRTEDNSLPPPPPPQDTASIIELLEDTNLSCLTAVEILNDILSYDKLEASDMKLNYSIIDAKSLLEHCVAPFTIQAQQRHIFLQYKDPHLIQPYLSKVKVSVDINRFGQVIRNIISNALKFTPPGGVISVKASEIKNTANSSFPVTLFSSQDTTETPTEDQTTCDLESNSLSIPQHDGDHNILRIDISDTGPGITKEQQKSLLREVVQFHDPLSTNMNGAGLGLWISKSIIDLHGGTLSVTSEGIPGKGCTFTICLVIHSYDNHTSPLPNTVGLSISQHEITPQLQELEMIPHEYSEQSLVPEISNSISSLPIALCVDDSNLNRKFLGKFLSKYFRVVDCVNGIEAVEYIQRTLSTSECPSIIFMDNVMPIMDGLEATSIIRSIGYLGPIVGVTGNCLPEQIEEFSMKGASIIVQKPLKLNSFGKLILDVMGENAPEGLKIS